RRAADRKVWGQDCAQFGQQFSDEASWQRPGAVYSQKLLALTLDVVSHERVDSYRKVFAPAPGQRQRPLLAVDDPCRPRPAVPRDRNRDCPRRQERGFGTPPT